MAHRKKSAKKNQESSELLKAIFGANDPDTNARWQAIKFQMDNWLAQRSGLSIEEVREISKQKGGVMRLIERAALLQHPVSQVVGQPSSGLNRTLYYIKHGRSMPE